MIRLSGWDASMLYSETPTVHMHTLKVAVLDLATNEQHCGIEQFRQVIARRLYKLDPFRFELIDIPFKFHHPMWRENVEIDLDYHVRAVRVASPGGRRQVDEVVGEIASTPLDRSRPLWELYLLEGLADNRAAVIRHGQIHLPFRPPSAMVYGSAHALQNHDAGGHTPARTHHRGFGTPDLTVAGLMAQLEYRFVDESEPVQTPLRQLTTVRIER